MTKLRYESQNGGDARIPRLLWHWLVRFLTSRKLKKSFTTSVMPLLPLHTPALHMRAFVTADVLFWTHFYSNTNKVEKGEVRGTIAVVGVRDSGFTARWERYSLLWLDIKNWNITLLPTTRFLFSVTSMRAKWAPELLFVISLEAFFIRNCFLG